MNLETLLSVPRIDPEGGFDLSPDGRSVVYAWNRTGRWELYEGSLDRSDSARQLTTGSGASFAPRYSPDGDRIAYVVDANGSEAYDVYIFERQTGRHICLTPNSPEAYQPNLSWSPDGRQLACLADRSGVFDTWILSVADRETAGLQARVALALTDPDWDVCWSPDGDWLAVMSEGRGQDYAVTLVSLNGQGFVPITLDGQPINLRSPRWSPDSSWLAFSSNLHGAYELGLYSLESGSITWIAQGGGEHELPAWSPDGNRLACVVSKGPVSALCVLDRQSGKPRTYRPALGVCHAPKFSTDGAQLYFIFENPSMPPDLWRLDLETGTFEQLTHSLPPELQTENFVMPRQVRYPSMDGVLVPALLFRPPDLPAPLPVVIWVHGGPNWLTRMSWMPEIQYMLRRGWLVLAPNYRGSTGYGRSWQLANRFDLGGVDTRDVAAGADFLVRRGMADPARLTVTGRSHGGYLTMTCLTQYPDRWAAGSAVVPFLNWFTAHTNSRADLQHWDLENFGEPDENRQLWHDRSPFFFLDQVWAPVQLICGENDPRCPPSESIAARDALQGLGREVDFLLFEGEGHSLLKTENIIAAEKRRIDFLARYLED
jgi:dipeptidyl aminopeptidase/acylaminoacyl peptidase